MKYQIIYYLTAVLVALNLCSCSNDFMDYTGAETTKIYLDVTVPTGEPRTRGYGDGSHISVLKCYVYNSGAELPFAVENIPLSDADGKKSGALGISLPDGGTYDFVLLATSCPQQDADSKVYFNARKRTLNLNYDKIQGNDEDVDCFFGTLTDISVSKGSKHSITLKRPFAQLNIGTKDLEDYNELASASLKNVGVSVDGVYNSMNVMDGTCVGDPEKVSFPTKELPSGQQFPVKDVSYLAMDYLLVMDRKDVNVSLTASNGTTSFDVDFTDIPLQRNYQTNIYGNLLTEENDFVVEINPGFTSFNNKDVDDPWAEYDLVIKLTENYYGNRQVKMQVKDDDGILTTIDLQKYEDSNHYIKLTWIELGLTNSNSISFQGSNSQPSHITHFLKCNIEKLGIADISQLLFEGRNLINVDALKLWDTTNLSNFNNMFFNCQKLSTIDLSNFDTSNVTDMSGMFDGCYVLESINTSNFDTSNVTDMSCMFKSCHKLSFEDLNFDTSNVTDMSSMFCYCHNLHTKDLINLNTKKVLNMESMFSYCFFQDVNLPNFDTSNVTNMSWMFYECHEALYFDLSNFDTSNVLDMNNMFRLCSKAVRMNLSSFDTRNTINMNNMFSGCPSALEITWGSYGGLH